MLKSLCITVGLLGFSCDKPGAPNPSSTPTPLQRGQQVVVEAHAAEFFEARVLEVSVSGVKVEHVGGVETSTVAVGDAYPVDAAREPLMPGTFAVCRMRERSWSPCQVRSMTARDAQVRTAEGATASLSPADVIRAAPVTVLNIQRVFKKQEKRAEFKAALATAGGPAVRAEWRASPRERVIVRSKDGWYSAQIVEIEDEGYRVRFAGDGRDGEVTRDQVIPEPPYDATPSRGAFVLVRPAATAGAWLPHRVLRVLDEALELEDAALSLRSAGIRDVVPLGSVRK